MKIEKDLSAELTTLDNQVDGGNELQDYIINYVGNEKDPEDEKVTVGMIIDVLAEQFPQLVLCISEENWVRGYQQALADVEEGERLYNAGLSKKQSETE